MNELHRQSIPLEHLTVGMFVVDLDVPWINSPFLTNSRKIKSFKDIDALRRSGVRSLVIDTDRGLAPKVLPEYVAGVSRDDGVETPLASTTATLTKTVGLKVGAIEPRSPSVSVEMGAAQKVVGEVKQLVSSLFESLDANKPIDVKVVDPLIVETLNSLSRNNQALMSLVHLSRKSQKLADHGCNTFCIALNMGLVLKYSPEELKALGLAALLHEAGWQQLPLNLMGKRAKYTANEETLIARHVDLGLNMLQSSNLPELVGRIIAEHHERNNGTGYPNRLKGNDIHPLSQILAIADTYDERIHQLQDRPGVLPRNALQGLYLETKKGAFEPKAMTAFISMMGVYPVTSAVLLESGEKGVVTEHDQQANTTRVKIMYDARGKVLEGPFEVFVSPEQGRTIKSLLDPADSRVDPFALLVCAEH